MKYAIAICLLTFSMGRLGAQSTNITGLFKSPFQKAEAQYQHLAYRNALDLYLYVAEKEPYHLKAQERIADCHFRLGHIDEAAEWYALLANNPDAENRFKYLYAQVLSIQGKYADAQNWFSKYLLSDTTNQSVREQHDFIYYLSYYYRDSVLYDVKNLDLNSDQADFGPRYFKNGLIFMSARDRDLFVKRKSTSALNDDESMLNVFYADLDSNALEPVPFYHKDLNSPYHDGPVALYDNNRRIVYTRTNLRGNKVVRSEAGRVNLKLYFAQLGVNDQITKVQAFPFNDDNYSISHPWISNDGQLLYFVSDKPGGYGGTDIYVTRLVDGTWSEPVNLGPSINTLGNEFYPYLINDSTLYFSSNGHGGLGGLDLYVSYARHGKFTYPENLGYPLNTSRDDFALIVDSTGRNGYFSSDRPDGKGYDDIYSFTAKSFSLVGKVVQRHDSSMVVPGATVSLRDSVSQEMRSVTCDDKGYFHFDLLFDRSYELMAEEFGYEWIDSATYSTFTRALGVDTLILPLWKHDLSLVGSVYSNESQSRLPNSRVILKNLTDGTSKELETGAFGDYEFDVVPDKKYRVEASKDGFIDKGFNINTKGLYYGQLVNDILLEEVFVEKGLVQFDFDKYELKEEYLASLRELVKTLKKNPSSTLNIAAFADSQGTSEYNQQLSDKRAGEILKYFADQGISKKRIEAIGFGEQLLLNSCSDGVECSDEEHSKNRRAEIKVQMQEAQ